MISLIIISYDGYSDCWEPFCKQLIKYFPEAKDFEIILSTTTKTYKYEGLNIKTIAHGNEAPWSKRLKQTLQQAKHDIVLPLTEDYFLKSKVDFQKFTYFVDLIKNNDKIDFIRILRYRVRWKAIKSEFKYLERINQVTKHRFLYVPGLWKKNILMKYLNDYENVFMAEKISGYRSWIRKDSFYSITEEYVQKHGQLYDSFNSGFIFKGKWVPWGVRVLNEEKIEIDFEKRGILSKEAMRKTRIQSKLNMLKTPTSTLRSFGSIVLLFLKSLFVKL
jgi:hypothetical protein